MFSSVGLTISGLLFISLIAVISFSKKKYHNVENQIYRFLLVFTIILLIIELSCDYLISFRASYPLFVEVLCRIYILGAVMWFIIIYGYLICISTDEKFASMRDVFERTGMKIFIVIGAVSYAVSCFLELTYTAGVDNEINVIGGKAVWVLYFVAFFVVILMFRVIFHNLNSKTFVKRVPIILFLLLLVIFSIIQLLYIDLNDLTFIFAYCVVGIYFSLENQDEMLVDELEVAKKNAETADRDKTEFLSKMSHEIRTPMNVIMGYCEYIVKNKDIELPEIKKETKKVYNASKNLLEIVNNILTYSRIESGREKVEEVNYSILDIIGEIDSYARARIDSNDVRFIFNIADNLPVNYFGDKLKIYRVILSLVNNAIKYTSKGEIEVSLKGELQNNEIEDLTITVKDTGSGMSKEGLDLIRAYMNESMMEEKVLLGSGLGIALSQKIVSMLDGKMEISSENGKGTTVTIRLKQKVVNYLEYKDVKTMPEDNENIYFDCSQYRILVVDDNRLNRIVMERLLKPYKIQYDLLSNGEECISRVKSGVKYDLILLDHMMPEMDGIETIRILKKLSVDLPPIIAVTANIVTELKELYDSEGFDGYLAKPIDLKALNQLMVKYFKAEDGGK